MIDRQTLRIIAATTRRLARPLIPEWEPGVAWFDLILVELRSAAGVTGVGFGWTPGVGSAAVEAIIREDIFPLVVGIDGTPDEIWNRMHDHTKVLGAEGPSYLAMAAVDLAVWDLMGRTNSMTITQMIGQMHESVPVYRSGINFYHPTDDIVQQVERWVRGGTIGIKIKIGRPQLSDDISLIRRVKEVVGSECRLMVDANRRWSLESALKAVEVLVDFDVLWLEEPLDNPNLKSLESLRRHRDVPIALGENVYSLDAFRALSYEGVVDVVQPNVVRVGGITPFLKISDLCASSSQQLVPHLLPELSGQLALTLPSLSMVEIPDGYTFSELALLKTPAAVRVENERLSSCGLPGLGMDFLEY